MNQAMEFTLEQLFRHARDLTGPGSEANGEYLRAITELVASFLPGDAESAYEYVRFYITR